MHADTSRNWFERPFSSFEFWIDLKSLMAVSIVTWLFLRKCCPSFNLGDLLVHLKSLVHEKSAVFAFYAGAQNARLGQI